MSDSNSSSGDTPSDSAPPVAQESNTAARHDAPGSTADFREAMDAEVLDESSPSQPTSDSRRSTRPRRKWVPVTLFGLTCVSTFLVGACQYMPFHYFELAGRMGSLMPFRQVLLRHWDDGLLYMACVLAILFAHEMGHFVATILHRVRASLPYFIPIPYITN
jgi:hypothetical protein